MSAPILSDKEFIELWNTHKSASKIAKILDCHLRSVNRRRRSIEDKYKMQLGSETPQSEPYKHLNSAQSSSARYHLGIEEGTVIVFSDAHFWPGIRTTAFKGLLWAIEQLKPKAVICNGDAFDGASISRFPRIGWDKKPSVIEELKACEAALGEIEETATKARHNVKLVWPLGNHCARFENRLAQNAGEFEGVAGFTLKDHFPAWIPCWSTWITEDIVVKHRYKGGVHATHNNTVSGGKSIVTGHLHSLKVTPYTDYNGTRYGVDTGTLADIDGPQFVDYTEASPVNWVSGFVVLTLAEGKLLMPEPVKKWEEGKIEFRGKIIDVAKY